MSQVQRESCGVLDDRPMNYSRLVMIVAVLLAGNILDMGCTPAPNGRGGDPFTSRDSRFKKKNSSLYPTRLYASMSLDMIM